MKPIPLHEHSLLMALRAAEEAYQQNASLYNEHRLQQANEAYIVELNRNLHLEAAQADEHRKRLIPHRAVEIAAGIIWITVVLFVCLSG